MKTRSTDQNAGMKNPSELADMGSIFDAAWGRLRAMGLVVRGREIQQRNRLAGIVIRLMHDGQNIGPDIVTAAADDFQRSSTQIALSAAGLHRREHVGAGAEPSPH